MLTFSAAALRAARVATGRLGWPPDAFWGATPAELLTALEGLAGVDAPAAPLAGGDLQRLMERFPDGR